MKNKILLCTSSFVPGLGGVPAYARDLVDAFRNDYEIVVVTGIYDSSDTCCPIHYVDDKDLSFRNADKLISIIEKEKPNIIINSSFLLLTVVSPFVENSIRIISVSHFVNGYYARVAGFNAKYLDKIIALSSFGKTYIEKKYKVSDKRKVAVVYNFMEPLDVAPNEEKLNRKTLHIVYPGGSNYKKSADIFLKCVLHLLRTNYKFKLYWLGQTGFPGGRWKLTKLKRLEDILPQDERIVHLGFLERKEAMEIMKDANVFVLPSRGEGFPISLIEAMRGKCIPIISDAKHGALDVIMDGKNGFVTKQGDYLDLFNCIEKIIIGHKTMKEIYDKSFETYNNYLSKQVWIGNMKKIITEDFNHKNRKRYSKCNLYFILTIILTRLYIIKHRLKEKIIDNSRTMIAYRIINVNKERC